MPQASALARPALALALSALWAGCKPAPPPPPACEDACGPEGARECSGDGWRECARAGECLAWGAVTACKGAQVCDEGRCRCENTCPADGATRCAQGQLELCVKDSKGCLAWGARDACPDGWCDVDHCVRCDSNCPYDGAKRCDGYRIQTCVADAHGCRRWAASEPCAGGWCSSAASACVACDSDCPRAGATRCEGLQVRLCNADAKGCLHWSAPSACGGGWCDSATDACVACDSDCVQEGATRCDGPLVVTCARDAHGCLKLGAPAACTSGTCQAATGKCGACVPNCTQAGAKRCSAAGEETCTDAGGGCLVWSAPVPCGAAERCGETGECVPIHDWTLLVYMNADNDLESYGLLDLVEMAQVGSSARLNLVVQVDRTEALEGDLGAIAAWKTTRRFLVEPQGFRQLGGDLGELDLGQAASLSDFVTWGLRNFPASHRGVVFWDHGGAWRGFGTDHTGPNGPLSPANLLTLAEISTGLSQGLAAAGVPRLDLVGFDACLMATVEVVSTVRDLADWLVASEETEPGDGWQYDQALSVFSSASGPIAPEVLADSIVDTYFAQFTGERAPEKATATLSVIDLSQAGPLLTATSAFATAATSASASPLLHGTLAQARDRALEYEGARTVDVGDFSSRIGPGLGALTNAATALQAAVTAAVTRSVAGPARAASHGVSVYFPATAEQYDAAYDQVAWSAGAGWRAFLSAFYARLNADTTPPDFTNEGGAADGAAVAVWGDNAAPDLAEVQIVLGEQEGGALRVLGTLEAQPTGSTYVTHWGYQWAFLSNGTAHTLVPLTFQSFDDAGVPSTLATADALWRAPGATAFQPVALYFVQAGESDFQYVAAYAVGDAVAEVALTPGGTLRPLFLVLDSAGAAWEAVADGSADLPTTDTLGFEEGRVAPGSYVLGFLAVDHAGNYASHLVSFPVVAPGTGALGDACTGDGGCASAYCPQPDDLCSDWCESHAECGEMYCGTTEYGAYELKVCRRKKVTGDVCAAAVECTSDACVNSRCLQPCADTTECPYDEWCDPHTGTGACLPQRAVGAACDDDEQCLGADAFCGPAPDFPGGYCMRDCSTAGCPTGAACYGFDDDEDGTPDTYLCLDVCIPLASDCRAGYFCDASGGTPVCWPAGP